MVFRMRFACLVGVLVIAAGSIHAEKRDYGSQPFRLGVAIGDSVTAGGTALSPEECWVSLLARLINESQVKPVEMVNNGIGANLISPRSTLYEKSQKPSAQERYQEHVIAYRPDLVLFAYGLGDALAGSSLTQFLEDHRRIVLDIKQQTGAVVVIVNASFMTAFDRHEPFNRASVASIAGANAALKRLAEECDVLYADVFGAQGMAPWTVDPVDGVHPNNLGHRLIANRVFEVLAQNCSGLSQKALELRKTFKPWRPTREKQIQREFFEKQQKQQR
jgi:lysophospholipase L1-like esterase